MALTSRCSRRSGSTAIHAQQDELDCRRDWRTARNEGAGNGALNPIVREQLDDFEGHHIERNENGRRFTRLSGRAHPGAKSRSVGGRLVMGMMVAFVENGLGRGNTADPHDTEDQQDGHDGSTAMHHTFRPQGMAAC